MSWATLAVLAALGVGSCSLATHAAEPSLPTAEQYVVAMYVEVLTRHTDAMDELTWQLQAHILSQPIVARIDILQARFYQTMNRARSAFRAEDTTRVYDHLRRARGIVHQLMQLSARPI